MWFRRKHRINSSISHTLTSREMHWTYTKFSLMILNCFSGGFSPVVPSSKFSCKIHWLAWPPGCIYWLRFNIMVRPDDKSWPCCLHPIFSSLEGSVGRNVQSSTASWEVESHWGTCIYTINVIVYFFFYYQLF